jgi:hypothetical protein
VERRHAAGFIPILAAGAFLYMSMSSAQNVVAAQISTQPPAPEKLTFGTEFIYASIGVGLSVLMPFLLAIVKRFWPGSSINNWTQMWALFAPYLALGGFSVVVGVLVAAVADFETKELALVAGFAWDKTLQVAKIVWEP